MLTHDFLFVKLCQTFDIRKFPPVVAHLRSASAWTSATPHALSAALRVSGVTINSASPTRLRLFPHPRHRRCATTPAMSSLNRDLQT